jgi:hypothetical protein
MKLSKTFVSKIFWLLFFLAPLKLHASACCGGAFTLPAVITGDDAGQVTTSLSQSKIEATVDTQGVWTKNTDNDTTQIFKLDMAHIFQDRWQAGISISVQTHSKQNQGSSSGFGDIATQLGYEYLPEWDYNPWKPKGIGFLSLVLPTGKPYEAAVEEDGGLSSRGRGFLAVGVGTVLTKNIRAWDFNSVLEGHRAFDKTVNGIAYQPGYGGSIAIGAGWNAQSLRLGGSVAWSEEQAVKTELSEGHAKRYATGNLSASYLFDETWAATAMYSDQTLFGNPSSVDLSKTFALFLQKRWAR